MDFPKELEKALAKAYYGNLWDSATKDDMFLAILNAVAKAIRKSENKT